MAAAATAPSAVASVPAAIFIEDVDKFFDGRFSEEVLTEALQECQKNIQKYELIDKQIAQRRAM